MSLVDSFGRAIVNLRISVTDRCNLRCAYCIPDEDVEWMPRAEILTFEEIARFARVGAGLGIRKLRLTGGEPLLRKNLPDLVHMLVNIPGIEDLGMTTNGVGLAFRAKALHDAGLRRLNISLDTLDPEEFKELTRRDALQDVLDGLSVAAEVGFHPIKVNAVVLRGRNEDSIVPLAKLAREKGFILRFIEAMPIGRGDGWQRGHVVTNAEIVERLREIAPLSPRADPDGIGPASRWRFDDGRGEIGLIGSVTEPFCDRCNRIRITADGKLRTCLFSIVEHDIRSLLRGDASDEDIAELLRDAVAKKEPGHNIGHAAFVKPPRAMNAIGG